jgi:hypothetical protein
MSGRIYTICKTGMGVLGWNEVHLESFALNVSIEVRYPLFRNALAAAVSTFAAFRNGSVAILFMQIVCGNDTDECGNCEIRLFVCNAVFYQDNLML